MVMQLDCDSKCSRNSAVEYLNLIFWVVKGVHLHVNRKKNSLNINQVQSSDTKHSYKLKMRVGF